MNERFLSSLSEFIFMKDQPGAADIIFIPGNGYPQMAELAAKLWADSYARWVLPSGKFSITAGRFSGVLEKKDKYPKEYETEYEFLFDVLVKNGVEKRCILKEESASYTYENAVFSRKVTDEEHMMIKKAIICCKSFHARRCFQYYQLLYPDTEFIMCPVDTAGISRENWYKSDLGIEAVLGEIERCGSQFHEIIKDMKNSFNGD